MKFIKSKSKIVLLVSILIAVTLFSVGNSFAQNSYFKRETVLATFLDNLLKQRNTVRQGTKDHEDARAVQAFLNRHFQGREGMPPLKVDGSFGKDTRTYLEQYQREKGLTVDGVVGKQVRAAMSVDRAGWQHVQNVTSGITPSSPIGAISSTRAGSSPLDSDQEQQGVWGRPAISPFFPGEESSVASNPGTVVPSVEEQVSPEETVPSPVEDPQEPTASAPEEPAPVVEEPPTFWGRFENGVRSLIGFPKKVETNQNNNPQETGGSEASSGQAQQPEESTRDISRTNAIADMLKKKGEEDKRQIESANETGSRQNPLSPKSSDPAPAADDTTASEQSSGDSTLGNGNTDGESQTTTSPVQPTDSLKVKEIKSFSHVCMYTDGRCTSNPYTLVQYEPTVPGNEEKEYSVMYPIKTYKEIFPSGLSVGSHLMNKSPATFPFQEFPARIFFTDGDPKKRTSNDPVFVVCNRCINGPDFERCKIFKERVCNKKFGDTNEKKLYYTPFPNGNTLTPQE